MRAVQKWTARALFVLIVGAILAWLGSRPCYVHTSLLLTEHGQTVPLALLIADFLLTVALVGTILVSLWFALRVLYAAGWER
jgi:hypothetical protein